MTVVAPDFAGFFAAATSFRATFGSHVTFQVPITAAWPGGTAINPDTNAPYDAMIVRTNAEYTEVIKTCLLILKQGSPLRPQSDARFEPGGPFENMDIILDIDAADYSAVAAASDFSVNGQSFTIEEAKPFSMANTLYRWLVYGAEH